MSVFGGIFVRVTKWMRVVLVWMLWKESEWFDGGEEEGEKSKWGIHLRGWSSGKAYGLKSANKKKNRK